MLVPSCHYWERPHPHARRGWGHCTEPSCCSLGLSFPPLGVQHPAPWRCQGGMASSELLPGDAEMAQTCTHSHLMFTNPHTNAQDHMHAGPRPCPPGYMISTSKRMLTPALAIPPVFVQPIWETHLHVLHSQIFPAASPMNHKGQTATSH